MCLAVELTLYVMAESPLGYEFQVTLVCDSHKVQTVVLVTLVILEGKEATLSRQRAVLEFYRCIW